MSALLFHSRILPTYKAVFLAELEDNFKFHVTEDMLKFVERCSVNVPNFNRINFSLDVVPFGHYEEEYGCYGNRGAAGPMLTETIRELQPVPEKFQLMKIQFYTSEDIWMKNNSRIDSLKITPGPRNNYYNVRSASPISNWVKYGRYKKDSFDIIHQALKKSFGPMTPNQVLDYIKEDKHSKFYEERPYEGENYCLDVFIKDVNKDMFVTLSFLSEDLKKNSDKLIEILNTLLKG